MFEARGDISSCKCVDILVVVIFPLIYVIVLKNIFGRPNDVFSINPFISTPL